MSSGKPIENFSSCLYIHELITFYAASGNSRFQKRPVSIKAVGLLV